MNYAQDLESLQATLHMLQSNKPHTTLLERKAYERLVGLHIKETVPIESLREVDWSMLVLRSPRVNNLSIDTHDIDNFSYLISSDEYRWFFSTLDHSQLTGEEVVNQAKERYPSVQFRPSDVKRRPVRASWEGGFLGSAELFIINQSDKLNVLNWQNILSGNSVTNIRIKSLDMQVSQFVTQTVQKWGIGEVRVAEQCRTDSQSKWVIPSRTCQSSTLGSLVEFEDRVFKKVLEGIVRRTNGVVPWNKNKEIVSTPGQLTFSEYKNEGSIYYVDGIDLTSQYWVDVLSELEKLPEELRHTNSGNALRLLDKEEFEANDVTLSWSPPHRRFGARQDARTTVHINVGVANIEWFVVPYKHSQKVISMCDIRDCDMFTQAIWPDTEELKRENVSVHHFVQKPGDIVHINTGCVYWGRTLGVVKLITWYLFPVTYDQIGIALKLRKMKKDHGISDPFPLEAILWSAGQNNLINDKRTFDLVKRALSLSLTATTFEREYAKSLNRSVISQSSMELPINSHDCYKCKCALFSGYWVVEYKQYCLRCIPKSQDQYNEVELRYVERTALETFASIFDNMRYAS